MLSHVKPTELVTYYAEAVKSIRVRNLALSNENALLSVELLESQRRNDFLELIVPEFGVHNIYL